MYTPTPPTMMMGLLSSAATFLWALPNLVHPPYSAETMRLATGKIDDLSNYVEVCKCEEAVDLAWACDSAPLAPGARLNICIRSNSSYVEIDRLATMVVSQGSTSMDVVEEGLVATPSIADMAYVRPKNGVAASVLAPLGIFNRGVGLVSPGNGAVVSTSIPADSFGDAAGAFVDITGTFDMKLAGSAREFRSELIDAGLGVYPLDKRSYELRVYLGDEEVAPEQGPRMDGSGSAGLNGASVLLGMPSLFASIVLYWNVLV